MELSAAARRELLRDEGVHRYAGERVWRDRLMEPVRETGLCAVVVIAPDGGWNTDSDPRGHREYPILTVKCYADVSRDADGLMVAADSEDRARALTRAVLRLFQGRLAGRWGAYGTDPGLAVGGCQVYQPTYLVQGGRDQHGLDTDLPDEVCTAVTQFGVTCYT